MCDFTQGRETVCLSWANVISFYPSVLHVLRYQDLLPPSPKPALLRFLSASPPLQRRLPRAKSFSMQIVFFLALERALRVQEFLPMHEETAKGVLRDRRPGQLESLFLQRERGRERGGETNHERWTREGSIWKSYMTWKGFLATRKRYIIPLFPKSLPLHG